MPRTCYIWDGDNVAAEVDDNGDTIVDYTYKPQQYGELISQRRWDGTAWQTRYHQYDALGSTIALTDEAGTVSDSYTYDAWGNEVGPTSTFKNPFRWVAKVGYYWDSELGTYYVRARSYTPTLARWASKDPWKARSHFNTFADSQAFTRFSQQNVNFYIYVDNSAATSSDPSGLFAFLIWNSANLNDKPANRSPGDTTCEKEEIKCISLEIQSIINAIKNGQTTVPCFGTSVDIISNPYLRGKPARIRKFTGRCKECRDQIAQCVIDTLESKLFIGCGSLDEHNCCGTHNSQHHDEPKDNGCTVGACISLKEKQVGSLTHKYETGQNGLAPCVACEDALLARSTIWLCRGPGGSQPLNDSSQPLGCRNPSLRKVLIHEALHNCLGERDHQSQLSAGREAIGVFESEFMRTCP